jgi:hypothetical protein
MGSKGRLLWLSRTAVIIERGMLFLSQSSSQEAWQTE